MSTDVESIRYREAVEMTRRELKVLISVMSYERVFGARPSHAELKKFLGVKPPTGELVARGWLRAHGATNRRTYSATNRAWRNLWYVPSDTADVVLAPDERETAA